MEDDCVHMEDVSSDSQDVEEYCGIGSQPVHSFSGGTNFYRNQIFVDKKQLKMLLNGAVVRQSFDYRMEKSYTKLLKAKCIYPSYGWNNRITNSFSRVYSHAHHGLCMRHLAENLYVNQHCGEHLCLFFAAAKAYSFDEFSENFEELKYNCPEAAHVLENVLGFEKWSRAHFLGNRYDVMTTNIVESLNSILMDEREYPVSHIFNSIAKIFGKKFRERYAYVDDKENIFVPCAEKILRGNKSVSDSLYVNNPNGVLDQYTVFSNGVTAKFNLLERSCYRNSFYQYSSPIYKAASYLLSYSEVINVVPPEAEWNIPQELLDTKISPLPYDPKLGRKKVKRTKGISEMFKSKRRNRCSICKKSGHKRTTCSMANKS
ncbi:uncharacterized protein LOC124889783 [Capsicum annuum]|uniref:uncharacterized protein LOC124889783 n=1 Tax=Capsicum annuum TaxID=4072 RepID=UPI001FB0E3C8|nr:uncharacterized protein LOC124889783 [Capsicum annuum]